MSVDKSTTTIRRSTRRYHPILPSSQSSYQPIEMMDSQDLNDSSNIVTKDNHRDHYRTIDSFLDEAYDCNHDPDRTTNNNRHGHPISYYLTILLPLGLANCSDATEILCLSYILSDPTFTSTILQNDLAGKGSILASAIFAGMLVGGTIVGALSDTSVAVGGRKSMLVSGLFLNSVAGLCSAMARNVDELILLRSIAGLGIGATIPPLFTLVTELAPPKKRGAYVTVVASFWMVGSIFVALVAMLVFGGSVSDQQDDDGGGGGAYAYAKDDLDGDNSNTDIDLNLKIVSWRLFAMICALPSAIGFVTVWFCVPESPRFLALIKKNCPKATTNVNQIATRLSSSSSSFLQPMRLEEVSYHYPSSHSHNHGHNTTPTIPDMVYTGISEMYQGIKLLYSNAKIRNHTTIPLQFLWFTLNFGSYGLLTWINSLFLIINLNNVYFNALLFAFANLPGNIASGLLVDRIGRKKTLILSMVMSALSLLFFAIFASMDDNDNDTTPVANTTRTVGIVISACAFQAFSISGWNTIDCLTGEAFPTSIRSTGMGLCTASGRVGAMVAQWVNGFYIGEGSPVMLLIVASSTLVVGATIPCCMDDDTEKKLLPLDDELTLSSPVVAVIRSDFGDGNIDIEPSYASREPATGSGPTSFSSSEMNSPYDSFGLSEDGQRRNHSSKRLL